MSQSEFIERAKKTVLAYTVEHTDPMDGILYMDDILLVWYCKTLQNHKAILITTLRDGMLFEFTYNGDKDEAYLDAYQKVENRKYDREGR